MQKEIKYTGFSASPSDYECLDGDLSTAVGLVPEDSTLKPLLEPKEEFVGIYPWHDLVCIHKGTGYTNYITKSNGIESNPVSDKNSLYHIEHTNDPDTQDGSIHNGIRYTCIYGGFDDDVEIYSVKTVGNTLIVLTSEGMYYFLWKNDAYTDLGDHLPELPLQFALEADRVTSGTFSIHYEKEIIFGVPATAIMPEDEVHAQEDIYLRTNSNEYGRSEVYSDELKNVVTQGVMAQVNKAIANSRNIGKFMFPFFVRYAYRLYDGTLTMHSAPVLMTIASQQNPYAAIVDLFRNEDTPLPKPSPTEVTHYHCHIYSQDITYVLFFSQAQLSYKLLNSTAVKAQLSNWEDIIQSVDIFVSEPLWTIDQGGFCEGTNNTPNYQGGHSICRLIGYYDNYYKQLSDTQMFAGLTYGIDPTTQQAIPLTNYSNVKMAKAVTHERITGEGSRFYLLHSVKPQSLNESLSPISIPSGYLLSLNSRELMTDDYDSHDILIPSKAYPYNARLDITGLQKKFSTYHTSSMVPYTSSEYETLNFWVFIRTDQGDRIIPTKALDNSDSINSSTPINYLYFPYSGAYKVVIKRGSFWKEYLLNPHPTLNGAYYFSDWNGNSGANAVEFQQNTDPISLPNKIYTSEINNPFFFPVSGIITIGAANILDICSAARPLSEGQFGQFPLYAFTDEGVWALELSNDGTYKARQPITRDVCISPESITQMDTAVLFATDRGVMLISGSTSTCISDSLTSPSNFNPKTELHIPDAVINRYAADGSLDYVPFLDYIKGCRMIYDYVHQRIIVFNPEKEYAYVYSLKSKQWGMMASNIKETTNSYPDALAVVQDETTKNVVDYTEEEPPQEGQESTTKAVLVTRPLKLDAPDVLKTVNTVITRGNFERGHVKTILYGSRDLINWQLIGSSVDHYLRYLHGTPYKYFRIVLLCDLTKGENVTGSTIEYTPRLTDQVR